MPGLFLFLGMTKNALFLHLNCAAGALLIRPGKSYPIGMEKLLKQLAEIGIDPATIEALRAANNEEAQQSARLLIALYDDRREFVD